MCYCTRWHGRRWRTNMEGNTSYRGGSCETATAMKQDREKSNWLICKVQRVLYMFKVECYSGLRKSQSQEKSLVYWMLHFSFSTRWAVSTWYTRWIGIMTARNATWGNGSISQAIAGLFTPSSFQMSTNVFSMFILMSLFSKTFKFIVLPID